MHFSIIEISRSVNTGNLKIDVTPFTGGLDFPFTGYQIGGIGPFGLRQPLPVFLDDATAQHEEIVINAGARGTMIRLSTADLSRLTDATVADIRIE